MESMDSLDLDTISDCSRSLNCASPNTSTLSGLSDYREEFLELRHAIDSKYPKPIGDHSTTSIQNLPSSIGEERVKSLSIQLQDSLKLNERYKHDIYSLKRRTELEFNEKFEKLLKQNSQLEANLDTANNQVKRLIDNYSVKNDKSKISVLESKIVKLERVNSDLNSQNLLLSQEIIHHKHQKNQFEDEIKSLKLEISDLTLNLSTKTGCVQELKEKIAQQYVELQGYRQQNLKLSHDVTTVSNQVIHAQKLGSWYKEHLDSYQIEKKHLCTEIYNFRRLLTESEEKVKFFQIELNKCQCKYEEIQLKTLQEKETLLKKIESTYKPLETADSTEIDINAITRYYEATVQDLTDEVVRIKGNIEEQNEAMAGIMKDNGELLGKYLLIQTMLQHKEGEIEGLNSEIKTLRMKLSLGLDAEKASETQLFNLKKIISGLEVELEAKKLENAAIEKSVKIVKEQFGVFKGHYEHLKRELHQSKMDILQLQADKQDLFMKNNWKTCELEKSKEKINEIKLVQEKLLALIQSENHLKFENSKLLKEIQSLKCSNLEQSKLIDLNKTSNVQFENMISNIKQQLQEKDDFIENLEDNISILKKEIQHRDLANYNGELAKFDNHVAKFVVNNYANFLKLNNCNVINMLENVAKLLKIDCNVDSEIFSPVDESEYIKFLLSKIDKCFEIARCESDEKENVIAGLRRNLGKLKKQVLCRIAALEKRFEELHRRTDENVEMFLVVSTNDAGGGIQEEVKRLKAMLEVKIREQKEKQKRYEANYCTLLRKVKEHMKYRNLAEKQNMHLQQLYDSLSDEYNSVKLQVYSKDHEVQTLENFVENTTRVNEKLKLTVSNLEIQLNNITNCENCVAFQIVSKRLSDAEDALKYCDNNQVACQNDLKEANRIIGYLKRENQELWFKISEISARHNNYGNQIEVLNVTNQQLPDLNNLESALAAQKNISDDFSAKLLTERANYFKIWDENGRLCKVIEEITGKNQFLSNKLEILAFNLKQRSEEVEKMHAQNIEFEKKNDRKDTDTHNLIMALKNQLQSCKTESDLIKNDKFFLQRLCKDLKVALQIHVNHNKALKNQLMNLSKEKSDFTSLPAVFPDLPSPGKFDEDYINRLLLQNKAPLKDRPLNDIQELLDGLKSEISGLQKRILEKNMTNVSSVIVE